MYVCVSVLLFHRWHREVDVVRDLGIRAYNPCQITKWDTFTRLRKHYNSGAAVPLTEHSREEENPSRKVDESFSSLHDAIL